MKALTALGPLVFPAAGAIVILLLDAFRQRKSKSPLAVLSLAWLAGSAVLSAGLWGRDASAFGGLLRLDDAAILAGLLVLGSASFAVLLGWRWIQRLDAAFGEFYGLILLASAGLMIMIQTRDLLVVFLGLEVFSVSAYGLTGPG